MKYYREEGMSMIPSIVNCRIRRQHTCEVQTLFRATKPKVCASIVPGRSRLARTKGMRIALRRSCGRNARDSKWNAVDEVGEEEER